MLIDLELARVELLVELAFFGEQLVAFEVALEHAVYGESIVAMHFLLDVEDANMRGDLELVARDHLEQRRFPDTVAADQAVAATVGQRQISTCQQ